MTDIKELAKDLSKDVPRSPRERVGGFIIAGRALDKCRAEIAKTNGEYHFNCPLDNIFFDFTGITGEKFKEAVATGKTDEKMGEWIKENSKITDNKEIVKWCNKYLDMNLSDMDIELQEFMAKYIEEELPKGSIVYRWFDVYDIEEGRIKQ